MDDRRRTSTALSAGRLKFFISGCHDHLRDHGFLRTESGWQLAPDEGVHVGDIDLVVVRASFYRLSAREARAIVDEVRDAFGSWRTVAASVQLGELEIETLSDAIEA